MCYRKDVERDKPDYSKQYDGIPYTYEDGYLREPVPDGTIDIYSNRQLEQLRKFTHLHEQINIVQEHIEAGKTIGWFMKVQEDGRTRKEDMVFMMDGHLLDALHKIASHMYEEFSGNEMMKEAIDEYLASRRREKETEREFEIHELENLWNTP